MRAVIIYALTLILARIIGRKLISKLTFFDFVVGVSMGSLVANAMVDPSNSSSTSVISLIAISILTIAVSFINTKSFNFRKLTDSELITIVQNGKIVEENMKNIRMTVGESMMKMKEENAFSLADVEFAIMETDGQLSVLPKAENCPLTPSQMNIQTTSEGLMKDVIIDGNIMNENLKSAGMDERWLNSELKKQGIQNISDVFYACVYANKKLHISKKSKNNNEKHGKYGVE